MRGRCRYDCRAGVSRLLGLDIGGTSSRARISVDGDFVAEAEASSVSLTAAGLDSAAAALDDLLARLPIGHGCGSSIPGSVTSCGPVTRPTRRGGLLILT